MKKFLIKIIKKIIYIMSFFIFEKLIRLSYKFCCYLVWFSKSRNFKHVGKDSYVGLGAKIKNPQNITIGDNFFSEDNLRLETYDSYLQYIYKPEITIKNNVAFGYRCHIGCINKIVIDDNCLFGSNVYITDHFHGETIKSELKFKPKDRKLYSKGPVILSKNIWVGDNVVIMPNVKIGDNVIIGAGAIVTHSFKSNVVIAGNPAKIIKDLS